MSFEKNEENRKLRKEVEELRSFLRENTIYKDLYNEKLKENEKLKNQIKDLKEKLNKNELNLEKDQSEYIGKLEKGIKILYLKTKNLSKKLKEKSTQEENLKTQLREISKGLQSEFQKLRESDVSNMELIIKLKERNKKLNSLITSEKKNLTAIYEQAVEKSHLKNIKESPNEKEKLIFIVNVLCRYEKLKKQLDNIKKSNCLEQTC